MKSIVSVAILMISLSFVLFLIKKKPKEIVLEEEVTPTPVKKKRVYKKRVKKV
jgi:hypothetical protein